MTTEQQTLSRRPDGVNSATVVLPERTSRQIEELVFAAGKLRRSNTSFSASMLFIGMSLVIALLWFGFVFRQNAIEHSTNAQMELLIRQYQDQPKKWKKSNPFRYQELRSAVQNDLTEEYNFINFFKRDLNRDR